MQKFAEALAKRGFEVITVSNCGEAREKLLSLIPEGASVGVGGSVTIRDLNVTEELRGNGHQVYWHWEPCEEKPQLFPHANQADVYLCSANAVTASGEIMNVDGTGNRIASLAHGPKKVIMVVGSNKLVDGGWQQAYARIKRDACPPNARRLNLPTPCARTGSCNEAECHEGCMCNAIEILNHPTGGHPMTVILVGEAMGY